MADGWFLLVLADETTTVHRLDTAAIEAGITVGRSGATVCVDDPSVSRAHAALRLDGANLTVRDLGSRNGTRVGGRRIGVEPVLFSVGEVLEVGAVRCVLQRRIAQAHVRPLEALLEATVDLADRPLTGLTGIDAAFDHDVALTVGPECTWFRCGGEAAVQLLQHGPARRVLDRLVRAHRDHEGPLPVDGLFAAGWPDEHIRVDSARNRVYVVVHKLRGLGLRDLLLRRDDGWLLAPEATVGVASGGGGSGAGSGAGPR